MPLIKPNDTPTFEMTTRCYSVLKVSSIMEKFEEQFESLDIRSSVMEDTMGSTTATSTPQGQVDALIQQVREFSI